MGEAGSPVAIPGVVPELLWPTLGAWVAFLAYRRRRRAWPCRPDVGLALAPACLLMDAATLIAAARWPTPDADGLVLTLLWASALLSLTIFFALRTPDDGGGGGGGDDEPEPPWWPEFERDLRAYMRRQQASRPRRPAPPRPRAHA